MLTLTDLFCGAGGSSTDAEAMPGIRVAVAANHWRLVIESHQASHPDTAHDCADISQVDPRRYPTTDILWAFPSCTNHSIAKGDGTPSPSRGVSHRLARPSRSRQATPLLHLPQKTSSLPSWG